MGVLQEGQCDGGLTIDSPFGILTMQTLRKLPMSDPKIKTTGDNHSGEPTTSIAPSIIRPSAHEEKENGDGKKLVEGIPQVDSVERREKDENSKEEARAGNPQIDIVDAVD